MIKVNIYRNKNKNIYRFVLNGHAGFAKFGSDIVCSAVSFLVINTINSIEKFTNEKINYSVANGGYIDCVIPSIKDNIYNHDINLLLETMLFGLKNLKLEYKNYILIKEIKEV